MALKSPLRSHSVYALVDPRTDQVRYIGQGRAGSVRPLVHAQPATILAEPGPKSDWLTELNGLGLRHVVRVLEETDDRSMLDHMEPFWIAQGRGLGWPLTNVVNGGRGAPGLKMSPASRALVGEARRREMAEGRGVVPGWNKGRQHTDEHVAKISASLAGNTRAAGNKGKPKSPAHLAAIAAAKAAKRAALHTEA